MTTLTHHAGVLDLPQTPASVKPGPKKVPEEPHAPVGYRWVSRRWRVLPDGTRDYAAYHGKTAFSELLPISSKLRNATR